MSDAPSFVPPQPGPEHEALLRKVGEWKIACEFYMGPGMPPMQAEAEETMEAFGPFWVMSRFRADMMGFPFEGRASMGFNSFTGCYECTWIDSMTNILHHYSGKMDGKVLEMTGEAIDWQSGQPASYRVREEHHSDDEFVFEMFMQREGEEEFRTMRNHYKRA